MRELDELGDKLGYHKTVLHQIAIELGLLEDNNFIFQYDFTDYGIWGDKKSYAIVTPTNNTLIRIPKDIKEFENLPYKIIKKLSEYGFCKSDLS